MLKRLQITDPAFFGRSPARFATVLSRSFRAHHPHVILLRDKSTREYRSLAKRFIAQGRRLKTRLFLHGDPHLARKLKADGVHLTSRQRHLIPLAKKMGLFVSVSCHNLPQAQRALRLGANWVTLSPVFASPGKGAPIGLAAFKAAADKIGPKLVALGGIIHPTQVAQLEASASVAAFASIRYFLKEPDAI